MRWSCLFIPTLREDPASAHSVSHRLLLRAGYLRETEPGAFDMLVLARRSLRRIVEIVRTELDRVGAQEVQLDSVRGSRFAERVASAAAGELRSYKQLPQTWYQVDSQIREDPRPGLGLAGARTQVVVRVCRISAAPGQQSGDGWKCAFVQAAKRCQLETCGIEAPGGGSVLVVASPVGEQSVACIHGMPIAHSALASASAAPPEVPDPEGDLVPQLLHTPDRKTIAEVAEFVQLPATSQMKSFVTTAGSELVMVLVRGDHTVSEAKLARVLRSRELRPATDPEIRQAFGAGVGSLGPVGAHGIRILADRALQGRANMICGANRDDYHLRHVTPGEDFIAEFHDLRQVVTGEETASGERIELRRAMELASIQPAEPAPSGLLVVDAQRQASAPWFTLGTVYLERILAAAAERYSDDAGLTLPFSLAPFDVVITPVAYSDETLREAADSLYGACRDASLDVLLDDREERPGVKFKDADLVGIPSRITIGRKISERIVEVHHRRNRTKLEVPLADAVGLIKRWSTDGD